MEKSKINKKNLTTFKKNYYTIYTSVSSYKGAKLAFLINLCGNYKVVHGEKILYQGICLENAIEAWNKA